MSSIDPTYPLASGAATNPVYSGRGEDDFAARLASLPSYTRSLLRIRVPVKVTLASKRQSIGHVLELAPGAILHFGKPCDDPLTLSIGSRPVAVGETVKIGEKFGLRITSMVMPEEEFEALMPRKPAANKATEHRS